MKLDIKGPYASDRQRRHEEMRRQQIADAAARGSDFLRRLRNEEAEKNARGKVLFGLWWMLHRRLTELEEQRDLHAPKHPGDEWDGAFCEAIREIPAARDAAREMWLNYTACGKDSGGEVIEICRTR